MLDQTVVLQYIDPRDPKAPMLCVRFQEQPEINEELTRAEGAPVYDNVIVAYVFPPGNAKSEASLEMERTLPDGTLKKHPRNWQKYRALLEDWKGGDIASRGGTPLAELSPSGMSAALIATLRARGVHSVEGLRDMADNGDAADMMGFRKWKGVATEFLKKREENRPLMQIAEVREQAEKDKASMQRQIDELVARLNDQGEKRGPGRPRKVDQEAA